MAQCGPTTHFVPNNASRHTTVVGFHHHEQQSEGHLQREVLMRGRSLLSELLLKEEASAQYEEVSETSVEECDAEDASCFDEEMDWEGSWFETSAIERSTTAESDRASQCSQQSQPIPIPITCYFKDEVQRAALEKLNQKRKWYQQQLEAERMMSKSIAKSKQASAAAKGNSKPMPSGRAGKG